ncbi:hypothetical protein GMA11_03325 [Granulicatella sp. zg-ZJ]|uniref:hypothetical protein n=1 Tax=Granulicatella sp. zg-ZJ TaxID=2678504 RepID=UPI0013D8AE3D|nr:hypothetical protein [Granulicatella sp. zg-ZJ]MBS4749610.1 hypothetical protein [Carnobacteriaceae bacterium zg-ZUI78]NEW62419.1 hypothetical protein [Granulicatella sp. zg-ZJ]
MLLETFDTDLKKRLAKILQEHCMAQNEVCHILNISTSRLNYLIETEQITPVIEFSNAKYTKVRLFFKKEISIYKNHLEMSRLLRDKTKKSRQKKR